MTQVTMAIIGRTERGTRTDSSTRRVGLSGQGTLGPAPVSASAAFGYEEAVTDARQRTITHNCTILLLFRYFRTGMRQRMQDSPPRRRRAATTRRRIVSGELCLGAFVYVGPARFDECSAFETIVDFGDTFPGEPHEDMFRYVTLECGGGVHGAGRQDFTFELRNAGGLRAAEHQQTLPPPQFRHHETQHVYTGSLVSELEVQGEFHSCTVIPPRLSAGTVIEMANRLLMMPGVIGTSLGGPLHSREAREIIQRDLTFLYHGGPAAGRLSDAERRRVRAGAGREQLRTGTFPPPQIDR